MINHARTLLLNRSGSRRPGIVAARTGVPERSVFFMEEFVEPEFAAQTLPSDLAYVHAQLFGANADNAYANFRVAQFMRILHSTEFVEYALKLDRRVTYFANDDIVAAGDTRRSQQFNMLDTPVPAYVNGTVEVAGASPRLFNDWWLEATDSHTVRSRHEQTGLIEETILTFPGLMSTPVAMPTQHGLQVQLGGISGLATGMTWKISTFNKPTDDLSVLLSQLVAQSQSFETIFAGGEPFTTFKKLWERHLLLPYRLSGLLLAFIYGAENLRHG